MKLSVFAFLILLFPVIATSQYKFETKLENFLHQQEYEHATVGVHVVDLESGESLFALNEEQLMIPASTLKLVTSAAALELLGSDYRFETKIGYTGQIDKNRLNGNLAVIGGGDPALGSEYFKDHYFNPNFLEPWAEEIKKKGIEEVRGDLILDVSAYDSEKNPPTWIWEDMGNYYGAGASALTVFDNLFRITFRSPRAAGRPTEIINIQPEINGIDFDNEVVSADIKYDRAFVFGSPIDKKRIIRGTIPKNRRAFTIKASMPEPERLLGNQLLAKLGSKGIEISGKVKIEKVEPEKFHLVYSQYSPKLSEIIEVMNHESVNLFAEHLAKQIALEIKGQGSRTEGIQLIKGFWEMNGFPEDSWFMEDGSGLSHFNAVPPKLFTSVLNYMFTKSSQKQDFVRSLAKTGEGTLIYWDPEEFPGGTLKAKSGSMTRIRCYAGYLEVDSGKTVAFSIMVNHFSGSQSKIIHQIDDLLYALKSSY